MGTAVYRNATLNRHTQPRAPHRTSGDVAVQRVDVCRLTASLFGLAVYLGTPLAALAYLGLTAARWLAGT